MNSILDAINATWSQIISAVSNFRVFDLLDIILIAYIIYKAIAFLRETRAGQLVKGILILLAIYLIAIWWDMLSVKWLLSKVFNSAIIAAAVIFQPELRRILERVGRTNFGRGQGFSGDNSALAECIDDVSKSAAVMQDRKIGALIVFERKTQLGDIINTGTVLDAAASVSMINNIFFPKSPLHDGAMIIRDGRLYAAGCILPLTQREDLSLQLGTRHRAAIGMTENSDAVVLVVSEENGVISLVSNGQITRNYNPVSAGAELKRLLIDSEDENKNTMIASILGKFPVFNSKKGKEDENK